MRVDYKDLIFLSGSAWELAIVDLRKRNWLGASLWVVMPGDTLWDIARTCWPEAHTGKMVAEIRRLNPGLDPGRLRVGQTLRLPVATEIAGGGR